MGCTQSTPNAADSAARTPAGNNTPPTTTTRTRSLLPQRSTTTTSSSPQDAGLGTQTPPRSGTTSTTLRLKEPKRWKSATSPPPITPSSLSTSPAAASSRWTTATLARERTAFFDTRVSPARPEIWQAIQLAVEMVRESHDLKGAASVLEAAGCTVQRHRLEEGVWDESGGLYVLPVWVVSDPSDVLEREDVTMGDAHGDVDGDVTEAEEEGADGDGEGEFEGKEGAREGGVLTEKMIGEEEGQKGKGKQVVAAPRDPVKVRARLSDRGTDVVVLVDKDENVKVVVQRILEEAGVSANTRIRLAYMGKMLSETASLAAQGWQPGHVINALVF